MNKIDLSGTWNFQLDSEKTGIENKYFKSFNYSQTINLPGSISQQKKSPVSNERATGYLTDPYKYEGWAWYSKEVTLPEEFSAYSSFRLILERTRYSKVWINGNLIGENNSLIGKHIFDFSLSESEKSNALNITILISNTDYIVPGGHMTSPDTQTNWNGITGELSLIPLEEARLEKTTIKTIICEKEVILNIKLAFTGKENTDYLFSIPNLLEEKYSLNPGNNEINFTIEKNKVKLWSALEPNLYKLTFTNTKTSKSSDFLIGFREFKAVNKHFELNGEKVFLRGKHDGMIFPETGFAPCDKESWLKILETAKAYGINHYRYHTSCPPEAAFEAADQLGVYMAPELPFWGTIQAPGEEGFNEQEQNYLIKEGYEILINFGNHPSFVMMSLGNELWGSEVRLEEILKAYHDYDDRHLYTSGSNNFQFWPRTTEHEDYFVGVRFAKDALIRGSYAMCDDPLGFIQTDSPNTNHNYDVFFEDTSKEAEANNNSGEIEIQYGTGVKKVKTNGSSQHFLPNKPCISHEVGQYCMYPDFNEIERYTGVLKPYNYEEFRNRLNKAGMLSQAQEFFQDSGRLAVQCYKTEIEAALRSNELSGFQLLDIQDFTGQGTAVVGVLNSFMESKGLVSGEQWSSFCNDTVLLASFDKYVFAENETLNAQIILHNYSNKSYKNSFVTAYIIDQETQEILCEEAFIISSDKKGNQVLGNFEYKFEDVKNYSKLALLLVLPLDEADDDSIINSYILHAYSKADSDTISALNKLKTEETVELNNVIITKSVEIAKKENSSGKKVVLIPETCENLPGLNSTQTVEGTYCTDFWCYPMFRSISESMNKPVPTGTLGLTIKKDHKLLSKFTTDSYTTPKWYNIISHSTCVNLNGSNIEPVVQMIDNFERNWKLGLLFEAEGIIVCTSRLWEIAEAPETAWFLKSLIN